MLSNKNKTDMGQLHSYSLHHKTKPLKTINTLIEKLKMHGIPFFLPENRKLRLSSEKSPSVITLITDGCFGIYHENIDRQIQLCFAPSIMGLVDAYNHYFNIKHTPKHYIRAETPCHGFQVPYEQFLEQIKDYSLSEEVIYLLTHRLTIMSANNFETMGVDSYTKIRSLLLEIWLYPEDLRNKINIQQLIQQRTNLSRSRTMRIIHELRKGNYIKVKRGKLISLNKLPKTF